MDRVGYSPVALLIRSLGPALAAGNTGAPCLVSSPDVQVISYTGSTTVGRLVAAGGASTLKRMNLELGGKTPMTRVDEMVQAALAYTKPIVRGAPRSTARCPPTSAESALTNARLTYCTPLLFDKLGGAAREGACP